MSNKNNKLVLAFCTLAVSTMALTADASPNVASGLKTTGNSQNKTTASSCREATAKIDLDINNVRARLMTGGDMWWDIGLATARYEVPKDSKKNSLFAGSVWIGGFDPNGQLKVAAQTYRQNGNDYWPGPLDEKATITKDNCSEWDRFWKVNKSDINKFKALESKASAKGDATYESILQWPAKGNTDAVGASSTSLGLDNATGDYAPFVDVNKNGIYDPVTGGDYPDILGDQFVWWVFNDAGNVKNESETQSIGIEVQASAFAYATKDFLNDATFYKYRLINRSNQGLDSTYIATWTDADLGYAYDDYIGCDTSRDLGILYNGKSEDGQGQTNSYGTKIPMVGIDFFKGPKRPIGINPVTHLMDYEQLGMESFTYYNNDFSAIGNPTNGQQIYYYMTGSIRNGQRFVNDFVGPNVNSKAYGSGSTTKFVFFGDPGVKSEWSECTCNNPVGDRRFVHSSGPFKLEPGVTNDIIIGAVWVSDVGGCPNTSYKKIRVADDQAQALFDNDFKTIEGPEAPRMVVRELDRKLVFYLANDPESNNYKELYGRDTAKKYRVASVKAAKYVKSPDSIYKFEGYRVFQLKNSQVTPAQIFNDKGEVNTEVAAEVFQCDLKNGITKMINYDKTISISDTTYQPIVKLESAADSGIKHSFAITIDKFATGADKRIVNYRNYYFVAIAYAYNNFAPFNSKIPDSTQDEQYLESAHGPGGIAIPVVVGMPNPANGDMGTVLNSDFGSGVLIRRLEGTGNGHNALEMTDSSEAQAVYGTVMTDVTNGSSYNVHQSLFPTYKAGKGPVDIKVVDPLKIQPANWELYIMGKIQLEPTKGLDTLASWKLVNTTNNEEIYSESRWGISTANEQIIEKYGLSVTIMQTLRPGDDQANGNGKISSDILFEDPSKPWMAGVNDAEGRDFRNWIRSGKNTDTFSLCDFNDRIAKGCDTVIQAYESLLSTYATTKGTWAPYQLASAEDRARCGFGVAKKNTVSSGIYALPSIDVVITPDKSKWTRCVVFEMQDEPAISEGHAAKFDLRSHQSWNLDIDANGRAVYSTNVGDTGMSWFPGYAINQETGERLNIAFSEDSWLKTYAGADMLWNPTSEMVSAYGNPIFGGKHYVYIFNSRYDSCNAFLNAYKTGTGITKDNAYKNFTWVGTPMLNTGYQYRSLADGMIPTAVRLKFRVDRPYAQYKTPFVADGSLRNDAKPLYSFSTTDLAPTPLDKNQNADKQALLDRINVVPNPYYGYAGYEGSRLETKVRIINLPIKAQISIYSLDGALIRRISKDNPNVSYLDWDIRNEKGLPIASGMYLIHVKADGIGETVLKWFGAMRPLDLVSY
ncbi:MAG: T9SS type A sorting domain-containing protein [Bacteroidetes bacterium]|nr:T9SS type A sorting domain-containing protein [Bacteroidota bacterium]